MAQRGIWKFIVTNFVKSLRRPPPPRYLGEDSFGNKYYEFKDDEGHDRRQKRWFVPLNETRFDQEVPVEWEAWLRYRRKQPPTPEEIETNRLQQQQTIENAKKLESKRQVMSLSEESPFSEKSPFSDFPNLPGHERTPGEGYLREPEKPDPPRQK